MKAGVGSFNTNGVNCEFSMVDFINGQHWYAGNSYSWVDILRIVDGIKILYLCSGLLRPGDVTDCCNQLGMMATCIDVELDPERHDLLEQSTFEDLAGQVQQRVYDAILMSPPCSTFSAARANRVPGGPRPLRGKFAPEIYGLSNLSVADRKKLSIGTALR